MKEVIKRECRFAFKALVHALYSFADINPLGRLRTIVFEYRFRRVAKFIVRHNLWWSADDKKRWNKFL